MTPLDLELWNRQTLALVQAALGAITPNFRMIALDRNHEEWILRFVLAEDDEGDREEIADIAVQFDALQSTSTDRMVDVMVTNSPIKLPSYPARAVFRRRED